MLPSESYTRDVQRISSALARGGLDLLGKGSSHPGNSLVDLDIRVHNRETCTVMYWRPYLHSSDMHSSDPFPSVLGVDKVVGHWGGGGGETCSITSKGPSHLS